MNREIGYYTGGNFNEHEDSYTQSFLEMNQQNFWLPEEISLASDLKQWPLLDKKVQEAYSKNLTVLTFLDTWQGDMGMNVIGRSLDKEYHQRKALLNFMAAVEHSIHSRSYSSIFQSYLTNLEIKEMFNWCENQEDMQMIMDKIVSNYSALERCIYEREYGKGVTEEEYKIAQYKAMVSSVFLESALFYTGFYYPLWFSGQGKLRGAGEIISLIIRDENLHGLYVGMLADEILKELSVEKQGELKEWVHQLLKELYDLECKLIDHIYDSVDLSHDVKIFLRYNFNKALQNLNLESYFETEEVNPVVIRGIDVGSKQIDYFSQKGDSYAKRKLEALQDEDFEFEDERVC